MSTDTALPAQRLGFTNIIRIKDSKNLYLQRKFLLQLRETVTQLLPSRWFELHSLGDDHFEAGQGHVMLERVGGAPVGSFHLWRDGGRIHVRALPELDEDAGEEAWSGCFRDAEDAILAISSAIDAKLRAWTLPSPGAIAAARQDRPS